MLISRRHNAGKNHSMKTPNRRFENVAQFKNVWKTVSNQNLIQEEIAGKLNSGNALWEPLTHA
jgi:hypothetical protein